MDGTAALPDMSIAPALMVGLAAFAPLALGLGVVLEVAVFSVQRLQRRSDATIPGALWLYIGSVLSAIAQVILG